jgi:septal ring factor EnvC (AmiA/AmiB activator)
MKGKQQGSLYWHPSCFGQGRSRKFNDLVWLPPQSVSSSTSIMVSSSSPPPFPILTSPSPLDWESEKQIKLEIDRLQQEIGIQKSSNLKKEIDAYETKNYRLKREHHNSMALSLLCEERIDAIETELSEMEVKRSIKDTQGMVVDDTHCKKCCERRIEYAVASCFRFGKILFWLFAYPLICV